MQRNSTNPLKHAYNFPAFPEETKTKIVAYIIIVTLKNKKKENKERVAINAGCIMIVLHCAFCLGIAMNTVHFFVLI
jgi:hypothetical protein